MSIENAIKELASAYRGKESFKKLAEEAIFLFLANIAEKLILEMLLDSKCKQAIERFCTKTNMNFEDFIGNDYIAVRAIVLESIELASQNFLAEMDKADKSDWEKIIKDNPEQEKICQDLYADKAKWAEFRNKIERKKFCSFMKKMEEKYLYHTENGQNLMKEIALSYWGNYYLMIFQELSQIFYEKLSEELWEKPEENTEISSKLSDNAENSAKMIEVSVPNAFHPWLETHIEA